MIESAVAERYARALFELGEETGKLTQLADDFRGFCEVFSQSAELRAVLSNPAVSDEQRTGVLRAIGTKLAMGTHALNAVRLLAHRRRLPFAPAVSRRLASLADERGGVVRVKVTSAHALSDGYCVELAKKIGSGLGKKAVIERATDPSLIAGVITQIGDNTFDGSLRGKLDALERQLSSATA